MNGSFVKIGDWFASAFLVVVGLRVIGYMVVMAIKDVRDLWKMKS